MKSYVVFGDSFCFFHSPSQVAYDSVYLSPGDEAENGVVMLRAVIADAYGANSSSDQEVEALFSETRRRLTSAELDTMHLLLL